MDATPIRIDDQFIKTWHPIYDDPNYERTERDEPEYQRLLDVVHSEIENNGSLTKETFYNVLRWKKALRGKWLNWGWGSFETFDMAINSSLKASGLEKMKLLVQTPGIGAPVASTLLHFVSPAIYPIIDKRTVGVLWYYGYIKHKGTDFNNYPVFMAAMLSIQEQYPKWSLREIDRAIFAYHKQNKNIFGTLSNPCTQR